LDDEGKPLLNDKGEPLPWLKRRTAAVEAGLEADPWDAADLVRATNIFVRERRKIARTAKQEAKAREAAARARAKLDALGELRAPFWVYKSHVHHTTKVHATTCTACNDGRGKKLGGNTKSGEWTPFFHAGRG
jgi:hypothetical protein